MGVEGRRPLFERQASARDIDMGDLSERVDASVGSAGAMNHDALSTELRERAFEIILDAICGGLTLPSAKGAPIVGDEQAQALHIAFFSRASPK